MVGYMLVEWEIDYIFFGFENGMFCISSSGILCYLHINIGCQVLCWIGTAFKQ